MLNNYFLVSIDIDPKKTNAVKQRQNIKIIRAKWPSASTFVPRVSNT